MEDLIFGYLKWCADTFGLFTGYWLVLNVLFAIAVMVYIIERFKE